MARASHGGAARRACRMYPIAMSHPAPVLLTAGQFYGTLAAARCLGRAGIPVTLAEGHWLAPARWSRYVARRVRCPEIGDTDAFLAWLLDFGDRSPGHVLIPPSDDLAWLFAENREALARRFQMVSTPLSTVEALLDKHALLGHCQAVGLDVPATWFPRSEEEALVSAREAGFPLLLKPRTQVQLVSRSKGLLVETPAELGPSFRAFCAQNRYGERIRRRSPDVIWPMLQRYYPRAREHIYGLSGYVDARGEIVAVRAARKILQRPRKLGIGLCFEEAAVDQVIAARLGALCRRVGYRGVFEVELVEAGAERPLIDFNPRFYSQMAFDIDRGMPLPRLAYADATGDQRGLEELAAEARAEGGGPPRVYCHRFLFEVILRAQKLSGHMSHGEEQHWRRWWSEHRDNATDAVAERGDLAPCGADVIQQLGGFARHPRSFVRSMVLDR